MKLTHVKASPPTATVMPYAMNMVTAAATSMTLAAALVLHSQDLVSRPIGPSVVPGKMMAVWELRLTATVTKPAPRITIAVMI